MIKPMLTVLGVVGFGVGAYLLMLAVFATGDWLMAISGLTLFINSVVILLVALKTPLMTWVESFIKKTPILATFKPSRRLRFEVPDEVTSTTARVGDREHILVPGTAFTDDYGFVIYPTVELIAPTFSPHVDKALEEIRQKYGIESWNDIKKLGELLTNPNVPEDEKQRIRAVLQDVDRIFKKWGESFTGDHVATYLANLSPHSVLAYVDQATAAKTANLKSEPSWKWIFALVLIFGLFIFGVYLISSGAVGGAVHAVQQTAQQVAQTATQTAGAGVSKVAEANTVLVG